MKQDGSDAAQALICEPHVSNSPLYEAYDSLKEDVSETIAAAADVPDTAGTADHAVQQQALSPGLSSTVPALSGFSGLSEKLYDTASGKEARTAPKEEGTHTQSSNKSCSSFGDHPSVLQREGSGTSQPGSSRPARASPFMAVCEAAGLGLQQRLFSAGKNMQVSQQRLLEMQQELMAHPEVALITPEACTSVFWAEHEKMQQDYYQDLVALEKILAASIASKAAKPEAATHHEQIKMVVMYLNKKREKVNVHITRAQLLGLYRVKKVALNYAQLYKQLNRKGKAGSGKAQQGAVAVPATLPAAVSTAAGGTSVGSLKQSTQASSSTALSDSFLDSLFPMSPAQKKLKLTPSANGIAESGIHHAGHVRKLSQGSVELDSLNLAAPVKDHVATAPSPTVCTIPPSQPPLSTVGSSKPAMPCANLFSLEGSSSNLSVFSASIFRPNLKRPSSKANDSAPAAAKTGSSISERFPSTAQTPGALLPSLSPAAKTGSSISERFPTTAHTTASLLPSLSPAAKTASSISERFPSTAQTPGALLPSLAPAVPVTNSVEHQVPSSAHTQTQPRAVPQTQTQPHAVPQTQTQPLAIPQTQAKPYPIPTSPKLSVVAPALANAHSTSPPVFSPMSDFFADFDDFCQSDATPAVAPGFPDMPAAPSVEQPAQGMFPQGDVGPHGPQNVMPNTSYNAPRSAMYTDPVDMAMCDAAFHNCTPHFPEADVHIYPTGSYPHAHAQPQDPQQAASQQDEELDMPLLSLLDDFMKGEGETWSPDAFNPDADGGYDCWTPELGAHDQFVPSGPVDSPGVVSSVAQPQLTRLLEMLPASKAPRMVPTARRLQPMGHYMPERVTRPAMDLSSYDSPEPRVLDAAYLTSSRGRLQPSYKMRMVPRPRPSPYSRSGAAESAWHLGASGYSQHQQAQPSRLATRGI